MTSAQITKLRKLLGSQRVSVTPEDLDVHSRDRWMASHPPDVVVFAKSREDVVRTLRFATRENLPVTTRGTGLGYVGGCVPSHGGIVLSVAAMNRIKEIHSGDFVAVVEPGVITGDLQTACKEKGLYYPPDPASLKECSIGGNVATNAGGPRCLKYGVTRNYVLGLEVVLADGSVIRPGGRTHKNKTGFDLIGMFVGSEGMLGVVTEATLRLIPHPPARATLSATFASIEKAAKAVQAVFAAGFLPCALEIADAFTLNAARKYRGPDSVPPGKAHLLLDLDGQTDSVRGEIVQLAELLTRIGALHLATAKTESECEALWEIRRAFSYSLRATGLTKLNEDVVVPRSRLVDLIRFASALQKEFDVPIACFGHAGDGNIHVNVMVEDYSRPEVKKEMQRVLDRLFQQVIDWGGAITGEHGVGLAKKPWWPNAVSPELRHTHSVIKAALDPAGLLNPGKFVD